MFTLVLQPGAAAGLDTYILAAGPTFNYGITTQMTSGGYTDGTFVRGLLRFDLSALPADAVVLSATLTLYCESEASTTNYVVGVHRALTQWYEGAKSGAAPDPGQDGSTWNLRNANGAVAWAGGAGGGSGSDYAAAATDSQNITAPLASYDWNVLADLLAWQSGVSNYGWWIVNASEGVVNSRKRFTSSDGAAAANRPELTIEYTLPVVGGRCNSVDCDDVDDYVMVAHDDLVDSGAGDFSCRFLWKAVIPAGPVCVASKRAVTGAGAGWEVDVDAAGVLTLSMSDGTHPCTPTSAPVVAGTWYEVYVGRSGITAYLGVNGVITSDSDPALDDIANTSPIYLNRLGSGYGPGGNYAEFCWSKVCEHTANYTPGWAAEVAYTRYRCVLHFAEGYGTASGDSSGKWMHATVEAPWSGEMPTGEWYPTEQNCPYFKPWMSLFRPSTGESDTYLASEFPDLNYGVNESLIAGVDGVNLFRSLVRFEVNSIPAGAVPLFARARFYDFDQAIKTMDGTLSMHDVSEANAGWVEGAQDGAFEVGSPCWNWRGYDTIAWAGSVGLGTAVIDYGGLCGSAAFVDGLSAWLEMDLNQHGLDALSDIINGVRTNGGFRLATGESADGDFVMVRSAEYGTISYRPTLLVAWYVAQTQPALPCSGNADAYRVWLLDPDGWPVALLDDYRGLKWRIEEFGGGSLTFSLHKDSEHFDILDILGGVMIERCQKVLGWWLVSRLDLKYDESSEGGEYAEVACRPYTSLLERRVVVPEAGRTVAIDDHVDDAFKQLVEENCVFGVREVHEMIVEVDKSEADVRHVEEGFRPLNQVLEEYGKIDTYDVDFDVVGYRWTDWKVFRTFHPRRGEDRTFGNTAGNMPVTLSLDRGTVAGFTYTRDHLAAKTAIYPLGPDKTIAFTQPTAVVDAALVALWGRREDTIDVGRVTDADWIQASALAAIVEKQPLVQFEIKFQYTEGCQYGLDFDMGDRLEIADPRYDLNFQRDVIAVEGEIDEDGVEWITLTLGQKEYTVLDEMEDKGGGGGGWPKVDTGTNPTTIEPDDDPTPGVLTDAAPIDHIHGCYCASPADPSLSDTSSEGVNVNYFSRSDHKHKAFTANVPKDIADVAVVGVVNYASREDHVHYCSRHSTAGFNHTHTFTGVSGPGSAHSHTWAGTVGSESSHTHTVVGVSAAGAAHSHTWAGTVGNENLHTHTVIGNSGAGAAHSHTLNPDPHSHTITIFCRDTGSGGGFINLETGVTSGHSHLFDQQAHTHQYEAVHVSSPLGPGVATSTATTSLTVSGESLHTHTVNINSGAGSAHSHTVTGTIGSENLHTHTINLWSGPGGAHSHTVTGTIGNESSHTHGVGTYAVGSVS